MPVYLERSVIDFRCVQLDHTYREKLVVRNDANTAMKVSVPNRDDVADYFEFSPNFGFVQVSTGLLAALWFMICMGSDVSGSTGSYMCWTTRKRQ